MKNKFLQTRFGECSLVCVANIFDMPHLYKDVKDVSQGMNRMQLRRLVEDNTAFSLHGILATANYAPIKEYLNVMEVDRHLGADAGWYFVFIASIMSETPTGVPCYHSVLVIKEINNAFITILDPRKVEPRIINIFDFFDVYDCTEIDILCDKETGGDVVLSSEMLSHLK